MTQPESVSVYETPHETDNTGTNTLSGVNKCLKKVV